MPVSEKGIHVVASFEGRALRAYKDEVGVWTIGYGETKYDIATVRRVLGDPNFVIEAGATITEDQAEELLRISLNEQYLPAVEKRLPGEPQNVKDAGTSFHYNTGAIARATWPARWLEHNLPAVHDSLLSWNKAGGKVLRGLTRRREREYSILKDSDYGPEGELPPIQLDAKGKPTTPVSPALKPASATPGMLRRGASGPEVLELQKRIAAAGIQCPQSGTFDEETEDAVRQFQAAHPQLNVDGIAGPATMDAVARAIKGMSQLKKTTGTGVGIQVATSSADAVTHAHVSAWVYIGVGVATIAILAYLAWKFSDEIIALARRNKKA